jgi:orotate phosphoribosyltransferase
VAHEYFDRYLFEADPVLLRRIVACMVALVPPDTDILGGRELGGVPLATILSHLTGIPALFVRKEAKTYETMRLAEGGDLAGRQVLLIEDVITTGGAVINAAAALREQGATGTTVVCAIDRRSPGQDQLTTHPITVGPIMAKDLLDSVALAT